MGLRIHSVSLYADIQIGHFGRSPVSAPGSNPGFPTGIGGAPRGGSSPLEVRSQSTHHGAEVVVDRQFHFDIRIRRDEDGILRDEPGADRILRSLVQLVVHIHSGEGAAFD